MSTSLVRTAEGWWVVAPDGSARLVDSAEATAAALVGGRRVIDPRGPAVKVEDLRLVAPLEGPCRVVAQMTNYRSHVRESGMNPDTVPLTFFRKSSGSLSGPADDVVCPPHVRLLDYEVEIGLVIGRPIRVGTIVTDSNVADYVGALVLANDVSARDVQLSKTQFYESKSYPTFTPVGPRLVLLEEGDLARFDDLRLQLRVNGQLRQDSTAGEMIYRPAAALQALARFQRLDPGDLVLTGTPGGTALQAPPRPIEIVGAMLPPALKWRIFFRAQASNPRYLHDGEVLELRASTPDGLLDLGVQRCQVRRVHAATPALRSDGRGSVRGGG